MQRLIFDTHAHYDDEAFNNDRDELLKHLTENGIYKVINAGTDIETSRFSQKLSRKYDYIYFAAGIHPENLQNLPNDWEERLYGLLDDEKALAVGEIGLDYHYDDSPERSVQIDIFEHQIKLANDIGKPVIVHDRDAHMDTLEILKKYRPKGVLHCFSGSVEMSGEILKLGMYIGIGGAVTFKNAKKVVKVVENLPLERLLLETDAPYMSPVPYRGKRCDSSLIKFTAEKIAQIKHISLDVVLKVTRENAEQCFWNK